MYFNDVFGLKFKTGYEHFVLDMITSMLPLYTKFHRMFDLLHSYNQNKENNFIYNGSCVKIIDSDVIYTDAKYKHIPRACIDGVEVNTDMKKSESVEFIIQQCYNNFSLY